MSRVKGKNESFRKREWGRWKELWKFGLAMLMPNLNKRECKVNKQEIMKKKNNNNKQIENNN